MNHLPKINQFYFIMAAIMLVLAVIVIVSLRSIFSAIAVAGQVDDSILTSDVPRLNTQKLEEAVQLINDENTTPLDL